MIRTDAELRALVERLRGVTEIALDCEFHRERRYYPRLCLVQIAFAGEAVAIDPFAVDLAPLGAVLADPSVVKVLHAAENDLALLADTTRQPVRNVFDTQLAAAFVGHGTTPAYTLLVERLCGVTLSKSSRYTDWSARPLSTEQVTYALDDVRYLPTIAATLRRELSERGRAAWAAMAIEDMSAKALAPRDRTRLYLRLGPLKDMSPRQLAILREVADWRDRRAAQLDIPPQSVAPDEALRQMAFDPPRTAADVERLRGLQRVGNGVASLLAAVKQGLDLPESECPPNQAPRTRDERTELVSLLLATVLRVRANELQIAPSLIANRDQLEELADWYFSARHEAPPEIVIPRGWRYAAVGELLLSFLEGRYSLHVRADSPSGITIAPSQRGNEG